MAIGANFQYGPFENKKIYQKIETEISVQAEAYLLRPAIFFLKINLVHRT